MRTLILAAVTPDNTPHGYNLTFAFPMLLFIVIGGVLYLLFSRPHRRVPARSLTLPARSSGGPSAEAAHSAAIAGGFTTAPGGGAAESHLEPHGAHLVASTDAKPADTTPAGSTPAGSTPAGSTPAGTTPAGSTPAAADAADDEAAAAEEDPE